MAAGEILHDDSDDELDLVGGEIAGVLAQRLQQLRDAGWLRTLLDAAMAQLTEAGVTVVEPAIDYCKIKPNRDINVALRVQVLARGREPTSQLLSCTLHASAELCRLRFAEEAGNEPPEPVRRQLAAKGFRRAAAMLADTAAIVRVFPLDPALPGLGVAADAGAMLPLFADRLAGSAAPRALSHEILHYKPRRSCAIHYTIDVGRAAPVRAFGKLSRDDRGVRHHALLQAAHDAAAAAAQRGDAWRAARPLGYVADLRLLLQEAVPGRDFRLVFAELTPDRATPAQLERAGLLLEAIARAIHELQRAPIPRGATMAFDDLLEAQERNLHYMSAMQPTLAADLAAIRRDAARLARERAADPLVFAHGDFAHGNVLIDGDRVGIIDFDKAGAAEPAYDVAYFLTHMWSFGIRHERRMPHVARLCQRFRDAYLALAPQVSPQRLALYEALDFTGYVLRNFRKQSHQADWLAWAVRQVAAAQDRLGVAAGHQP